MNREAALKIVLGFGGLLCLALAHPMMVFRHGPVVSPAVSMQFGIYVTLGVFLILAIRNPLASRSLIAFTAWSSLARAVFLGYHAMENMVSRDELLIVAVLVFIGAALLALAPGVERAEPALTA